MNDITVGGKLTVDMLVVAEKRLLVHEGSEDDNQIIHAHWVANFILRSIEQAQQVVLGFGSKVKIKYQANGRTNSKWAGLLCRLKRLLYPNVYPQSIPPFLIIIPAAPANEKVGEGRE